MQALFLHTKRENVHTVKCIKSQNAPGSPPPSLPQGKDAEHTLPKHQSMNLHSLIVPGPLCTFSWERQLIHLQPPKFNLSAVRTGVGWGWGVRTALQSPTVFSRRRPEEVPCPSGRVLRKNGSASPAPRHNTAIEAREKSLRKAGPAPPAGSRTLQVTFACTALIVNSIPDMESDKESVPCSEFKCTRFNKAVAYDPTSPPQLGLTHNLSSNTKRR